MVNQSFTEFEQQSEAKVNKTPTTNSTEDPDSDSDPEDLVCPLTQEIFVDPVITDDGYTYERVAIELWLKKKKSSPMTNKELRTKKLRCPFDFLQLLFLA